VITRQNRGNSTWKASVVDSFNRDWINKVCASIASPHHHHHPVTLRILRNILLQVLLFFFRVARPFLRVRRRRLELGLVPNLVCVSLPVPVELFDFCLTVLRFFFIRREFLSFENFTMNIRNPFFFLLVWIRNFNHEWSVELWGCCLDVIGGYTHAHSLTPFFSTPPRDMLHDPLFFFFYFLFKTNWNVWLEIVDCQFDRGRFSVTGCRLVITSRFISQRNWTGIKK